MKNIATIITSLFIMNFALAQTTATDFNVNDCDGTPHHLFNEMNAGKVVVLAWVMPCGACTAPAKTAYNVAKEFETNHPGKVIYYMADDYANTSCSSLKTWGANNIGPNIDAVFSDAAIKMSDYGVDGMPKIVVMGGSSHQIYYNENNSSSNNETAIRNAVTLALGTTKVESIKNNLSGFKIHPNPASGPTHISFTLVEKTDLNIIIYNMIGKNMHTANLGMKNPGSHKYELNTSDFPEGIYLVKINEKTIKLKVSSQGK